MKNYEKQLKTDRQVWPCSTIVGSSHQFAKIRLTPGAFKIAPFSKGPQHTLVQQYLSKEKLAQFSIFNWQKIPLYLCSTLVWDEFNSTWVLLVFLSVLVHLGSCAQPSAFGFLCSSAFACSQFLCSNAFFCSRFLCSSAFACSRFLCSSAFFGSRFLCSSAFAARLLWHCLLSVEADTRDTIYAKWRLLLLLAEVS